MKTGRTTLVRKEDVKHNWYLVDARNQILGRLASRVAVVLMGKHKPIYTAYVDTGDYVVVTNARDIRVTGTKAEQKTYEHYTQYADGLKVTPYKTMLVRRPEEIIRLAVWGMLPKTKLGRKMFQKLKVYAGNEHPHQAQKLERLELVK